MAPQCLKDLNHSDRKAEWGAVLSRDRITQRWVRSTLRNLGAPAFECHFGVLESLKEEERTEGEQGRKEDKERRR